LLRWWFAASRIVKKPAPRQVPLLAIGAAFCFVIQ